MIDGKIPSSFRDPSGFLFFQNRTIYRQVNTVYKEDYEQLINSKLYGTLTDAGLLIPHEEVAGDYTKSDKVYKIIKPELIQFISYPYEWCFSQLKDAALVTLKVQKIAFDFGMSLKDCSAYNIQFKDCKPVFIDTLSFEKYRKGQPWVAYRQFCQHFLAPLALMSYTDVRLNQLLKVYIDGIPLDLASSLLPFRSYWKFSLLSNIHLHARSQKYFADKGVNKNDYEYKMSLLNFLGLIDSLESAVQRLKWRPKRTEWIDYYENTNYSSDAMGHKKIIISDFLDKLSPKIVWDFGANIGLFSRFVSDKGIQIISFDIDPASVDKNYLECIREKKTNILPLLVDLTNPSPSIGWENEERMSFLERGPADTVLALALIHHMAISNNLPFNKIASFFDKICKSLIIEFVPKGDTQVERLLSRRDDIFTDYKQKVFEAEFSKYFIIENSVKIRSSERTIYLMKRRQI